MRKGGSGWDKAPCVLLFLKGLLYNFIMTFKAVMENSLFVKPRITPKHSNNFTNMLLKLMDQGFTIDKVEPNPNGILLIFVNKLEVQTWCIVFFQRNLKKFISLLQRLNYPFKSLLVINIFKDIIHIYKLKII